MAFTTSKTACARTSYTSAVLPARTSLLPRSRPFMGTNVPCARVTTNSRLVSCKAADGGDTGETSAQQWFMQSVNTMFKEYDFLSTGMGALCVTGWFWSHGQPPVEALGITVVATVVALVANELLFKNDAQQ